MALPDNYNYTQLDNVTRLNFVRQRIRDLETTYAQISLRVETPGPGDVITQQDRDNLTQLQSSLELLHNLETQLAGSTPTPAPAPAP